MQVNLTSGVSFDIGGPKEGLNKRPLFVQPRTTLLGLSATVSVVTEPKIHVHAANRDFVFTPASNGIITRLSLIHTPEVVDDEAWNNPHWDDGVPLILRTLWHPQASAIPAPGPSGGTCPIWACPNLNMINYDKLMEDMDTKLPVAFLPHKALIWARDADELMQVKRISVIREVRNGGGTRTDGTPDVKRHIIGMRVDFQEDYHEPPRMIGSSRLTDNKADTDWPEYITSHFEIDGPGGEAILHVLLDEKKSLLIHTTRNRICVWRGRDDEEWHKPHQWWEHPNSFVAGGLAAAFDAEKGDMVVGTALMLNGCLGGMAEGMSQVVNLPQEVCGDV
jgi:hypothetical protein